jgi:preprotein translocase subunit SecD
MRDPIRELEQYADRWRAEQQQPAVDWRQVTSRPGRSLRWLPMVAGVTIVALAVAGSIVGLSLRHDGQPAHPAGSAVDTAHMTELVFSSPQPLSPADRDSVLRVMHKRLHMLGVDGSVKGSGQHFLLTVPTADKDLAESLGRRGGLQMRQVLAEVADPPSRRTFVYFPLGSATDLANAEKLFAERHCGDQPSPPDDIDQATAANRYLVMCSQNAATKYLFAPAAIDSTDVASATPQAGQADSKWLMDVTFTADGATAWHQITVRAAGQPAPPNCEPPRGCNSIGMLIDGRLISVPSIMEGITAPTVQIGPFGSGDEVRGLAAAISEPLPVPLLLSSARIAQ